MESGHERAAFWSGLGEALRCAACVSACMCVCVSVCFSASREAFLACKVQSAPHVQIINCGRGELSDCNASWITDVRPDGGYSANITKYVRLLWVFLGLPIIEMLLL